MMIKAALLAAVIAAGGVSGQVAELAEAAVYEKAESSVNEKDVEMCAKLVWGEARGCTATSSRRLSGACLTVWTQGTAA